MANLVTKSGRDHLLSKGLFYGMSMGSIVTALLSGLPKNKVSPKDAYSNLSYMLSHAAYGVVSIYIIAKLGHDSLFDTEPQNNYLQPTELTTEQRKQFHSENQPYLI